MEFYAFHGCYKTEQLVGNKFMVSVAVEADISAAAANDDVSCAINYLDIYDIAAREMVITSNIIENVAKRIADALYARFPEIVKARVKVSKMHPPLGGKVEAASVILNC